MESSRHVSSAEEWAHVVVVGGGVSGLSAAERLIRAHPTVRVTVLEASARLGGMVHSEFTDAFTYEVGADSVVASKPATRVLCERLGIADRLHGPSVRGAYVYSGGRLRRLPTGFSGLMPTRLGPLATSGILSPRGLARFATEPWRRAPGRSSDAAGANASNDESIEHFVVRRMGREAYDRLVEPLLTGIYAGDGGQLSLAATFPQLRRLEQEHGSLFRGLRPRGASSPATSPFLSLPNGMSELVDALERALVASGRVTLRRRSTVLRVSRQERELTSAPRADRVLVVLTGGEVLRADAVVVATPAHAAAGVLAGVDVDLATDLDSIKHGSTATVTLAYAPSAVPRPLDATGYVVPRAEGRDALACTWLSSKWRERMRADVALFRVFLGGVHRPDLVAHDDADLVDRARAELRMVLGVVAAPAFRRVARWTSAMPQYTLGHPQRVARIVARAAGHPWLALAGNAYDGVGIPDCIRSGERAADRVLAGIAADTAVRTRSAHPADARALLVA